jgi:predicted O-linked N-acetylglucosamine transferase (SPINDLY family)
VVYHALRSRVLDGFQAHGVDAGRLTLIGFLETAEHFALYREVDLSPDPFPYNGTTAVCEGLWMGVPAVALSGETHAARVATSILTAVGLGHLVAQSVERYVDLAVSLARNVEELAALRSALRSRMTASPVMDGRGLAQAIEEAYRRIWRRWCADECAAGRGAC